ncbi:hypothetical protein ACIRVN_09475 [Streptomyces albogriseolus]|uniref:hypothetical protein n=1 Tax=Streptomyces albogriseolus TaxID=1887 RepID=UPI0037FE4E77
MTGLGQVVHGPGDVLVGQGEPGVAPGDLDDVVRSARAVHGLDQGPHPPAGVEDLGADAVDDAADPHVAVGRPVGPVLGLDPGSPHRPDRGPVRGPHRHLRANLAGLNCRSFNAH